MVDPSDQDIQDAGALVAAWQDVMATSSEDARFGHALSAFIVKLVRAAGVDELSAYAEFQVPFRSEPLAVAVLASPQHAALWEGNPHDWQSRVAQQALRREFSSGRAGALAAEDLWARPEFSEGVKHALLRADSAAAGALWMQLEICRGVAARLALWTLRQGEAYFLEWFGHGDTRSRPLVQEWPWEEPAPLKPNPVWATAALRCQEVARRLRPKGIPLVIPTAVLRQRNPPTGPRKGRALTIAEQACWYLKGPRGMGNEAIRDALGMEDVRQVRALLRSIKRKHAKWPKPPGHPLTSRIE